MTDSFISTVCTRPLDLGFIIDSSGSIGRKNFLRVLNFVKHIVASFQISSSQTRVGVIEYSNKPRQIFGLTTYNNQQTMLRAIDQVPYLRGGTFTGRALKFAEKVMFTNRARQKVAIVLTDGISHDSVRTVCRRMRQKGINVIPVGIGRRYSMTQLRQMATSRRAVFTTNFRTMTNLVRLIKRKACASKSEILLGFFFAFEH